MAAPRRDPEARERAVCLISGGMDSAVSAAEARARGFAVHALSIDYGQRHKSELAAAARVSQSLEAVEHRVVRVDLAMIGGSSLTSGLAVPKDRSAHEIGQGIPNTYVPARNTIFLAIALGFAEVIGAHDIFVGVNAVDYSGYPDCRREFLAAFESLARLATVDGAERGVDFRVHAPLILLGKREIVLRARELDVDLGLTHTCYDPIVRGAVELACGRCDACQLRLKGFADAGLRDPVRYADRA